MLLLALLQSPWLVMGGRVVTVKLLFNSCFSHRGRGETCFAKAMNDFWMLLCLDVQFHLFEMDPIWGDPLLSELQGT